MYKTTGDALLGYAEDQGVPYMLASDDVALGCSMAEAFIPFLLSFSRVTTPPDQLAILFYMVAGSCTEFQAQEQELRYLRAIYAKNSIEAQDARIAQQRLLGLAAHRQLTGYYALVTAMSEPGGECPEFASENEQLYWLLGLLDGIQAIINDIASGGSVEVPMDIAAKVGRGAACLDNQQWWGVPAAIQAAIWITIPGNEPIDKSPREVLQQAMQIGAQQGMSVAHVLAAQVYLGQGETAAVKQVIRSYAQLARTAPENQEFAILNQVSGLQIQAISDRLWTAATGRRTPLGRLGTFWDDSDMTVETIDIDELL
ncbi:hypothetical protein AU255_17760 [Methyloprofundus sedimenti]|uniref:Uncharacterized protein n=1 Tax=Methyloprofundus sedimenti TaxID=1420851 RepID=A0A1V8M185_9GAMM|nr:hypothetical protein [Methyloprofundus sedimenti]OQK15319.1 hypothetical protein AU255_17760 [Methyloprofundus sedimenti]